MPAAFGTWLLLLQRYGRLPLRAVMQYAIGYARDGYPMTAGVSAAIAAAEQLFREHWTSSAGIYLGGGVPAPGSRFTNPALAATYQRILDEAEAAGADRDGRSTPRGGPSTRVSWPRPSTPTWPGPRSWT